GQDSGIAEAGGRLLAAALNGQPADRLLASCEQLTAAVPATVIGFAETATGLGQGVADTLRARYLHSTRRPAAGPAIEFVEEHSHAAGHLLQPADPDLLGTDVPLVLVDDELSTGRTALNLIRALHPRRPSRRRYLIAALVDLRGAADRARTTALAAELGVRIEVVALATGRLRCAPDVLARGAALAATAQGVPEQACSASAISTLDWPAGVAATGRHGFDPAQRGPLERAAGTLAEQLAPRVGGRVLVLGCEELMYAPLRIGTALAALTGPGVVRFSATTRSPVVTVDQAGYPIRTRLQFPAHDGPADAPRYAYNVHPGADPDRRFSDIVLVVDGPADTVALRRPGGLLAQLTTATDRLWLIRVPAEVPAEVPAAVPHAV
ncbi:MAG TPA: phosphoribosyltransferase family protein, partial [Jatrophihabitans sp.]|nr:phosphoribosyltransferase family protein [Jatrophihabitans sp.]